MHSPRRGVTLIEVLVVVGIIALLLAILVPAVQHAREAARRTTCRNNLRQIGLAIQSHESAHRSLPSLYNGTFLKRPPTVFDEFHYHSWRTAILPQLEQSVLHRQFALDHPATVARNQAPINVDVPTFLCPSVANYNANVPEIFEFNDGKIPVNEAGTAARSDYEAVLGVHIPAIAPRGGSSDLAGVRFGVWGEPIYKQTGAIVRYRSATLRDVSDGLSNTMIVGERAGRPDYFRRGQPDMPYPYPPEQGPDHHQAAWGISTHVWWLIFAHGQAVNETNGTGLYGFHASGAHVALADGSVRFLSERASPEVLSALATRSAGDIVASE